MIIFKIIWILAIIFGLFVAATDKELDYPFIILLLVNLVWFVGPWLVEFCKG